MNEWRVMDPRATSPGDAAPRVAVVSMGGTISCAPSDDGTGGLVPTHDSGDGLIIDGVTVEPVSWSLTDSAEITFDELIRLAVRIRELVADGVDGVVVTQGTDTIDETAYALSLLRPADRPVVVTGAMRAPTVAGSDAQMNLHGAVATAIAPELPMVTAGAVVVMNDQIHSAKWVQKSHTQRIDAFQSGEHGVLGILAEGRPVFLRRDPAPVVEPLLDAVEAGPEVRASSGSHPAAGAGADAEVPAGAEVDVALLSIPMDHDARLIGAVRDLGYSGLVVEGMGGGHVNGPAAKALGELAESVPVVFSSRTRAGAVMTRTYGSPGAELDLIARGCVPSGLLTALKARILLSLLLRAGSSRERIREAVESEGGIRMS